MKAGKSLTEISEIVSVSLKMLLIGNATDEIPELMLFGEIHVL